MESLKEWAMTICFAALAAGLANIIAPKGNLEKVYKFAVSLFFLCCVLVPVFSFKGISLNLSLPPVSQQQNNDLQSTVEEQKLEESENNISALITETCEKNGVTPLGVSTKAAADKSGAISSISSVVTLKKTDMPKENDIISAVKDGLGIDITVKEGENNG
jgi:stage III sporulation protein AF